jgi:hypothetical protein
LPPDKETTTLASGGSELSGGASSGNNGTGPMVSPVMLLPLFEVGANAERTCPHWMLY